MKYYPVLMDVRGKPCLVVGGGAVGTRKALGLARAGALVRVVSPEMAPELEAAAGSTGAIELMKKPFDPRDLDGVSLVFAATDSKALNAEVRQAAARSNVLCNSADGEDKGDFILPSVVARGDLLIAISTCGASPALARRLRKDLEQEFGPEYGDLLTLLANVRKQLLARGHDPAAHKQVLTELVKQDLAPLIAARELSKLNAILYQVLGDGFSCDTLQA